MSEGQGFLLVIGFLVVLFFLPNRRKSSGVKEERKS